MPFDNFETIHSLKKKVAVEIGISPGFFSLLFKDQTLGDEEQVQ